MDFGEATRVAITGLLANRMRAMLTTLGIIIGVGAVISLMSLGQGVQDFIVGELQSFGANLLVVFPSEPENPNRTRREPITTIEVADLSNPEIAPNISQVAPSFMIGGSVQAGAKSKTGTISGVTPNIIDVRQWTLQHGIFISQNDIDTTARVVVLGANINDELFGSKDFNSVGQVIRLNDRAFTVIGVMNETGGSLTGDDDSIYVPISTAQRRLSNARTRDGGYQVTLLWVSAGSQEQMSAATREIQQYLDKAHNVVFDGDQDYQVANQADVMESVSEVMSMLTIFLGIVAGISLLVGGIGIMNIMLVSVTERTREIGLRKAVGARGQDILLQFLIESVLLSLIGGALGVAIGFGVAQLGSVIAEQSDSTLRFAVSTQSILLATSVSSIIGVFFGLYPASRAAQLRPIDALRFE